MLTSDVLELEGGHLGVENVSYSEVLRMIPHMIRNLKYLFIRI